MPDIPVGSADRLLRQAGASRLSFEASKELRDVLEDLAIIISKKAIELVNHRGQQTITKEDVRLAYNMTLKPS